jgi:glucose/arabinose dehydrogenase
MQNREPTPSCQISTLLMTGLLCLVFPAAAMAEVDLQLTKVSDLRGVVDINHAGDGSGRLFLVEQPGVIVIHAGGQDQAQPFLDITERVQYGGERGLLSMAFAPDYAQSGLFYLWYTRSGGDTVLSRFSVGNDPDQADAASEEVLLVVEQPYSNHNGGRLRFGPDGMLYLGLGDGGSANDPLGAGQDRTTLLGKLIRIDVEPQNGGYAIPADNPFIGDDTTRDEIWATGLRNPWRISFDRETGDLYIADVGQSEREEVNVQPASSNGGENYGWSVMEGSLCTVGGCDQAGLTLPVFEYDHTQGCSITGGEVYRGLAYPALNGTYLFADYCQGTIWGLTRNAGQWSAGVLLSTLYQVVTFGEAGDGSVYMATTNAGVFLLSDGEVQPEPVFAINAGMNDAWYEEATAGQGMLISVFEEQGTMFLAWFTFDVERPPAETPSILGEPGHRWLTAQGPYSGTTATLDVYVSSGGIFDSSDPEVGPPDKVGTATITWSDCRNAVMSYDIDSVGSGTIPLRRVVDDNASLCKALQ